MSDLHVIVTTQRRLVGRLDFDLAEVPDPPIAAVHKALERVEASSWTLGGGEPTLRADLPALLRELAHGSDLGLRTDGLALVEPRVVTALVGAGLKRVRISARADAHDWLTGRGGNARRVLRALRVCVESPLAVEAEVTVTRPTTSTLAETVGVLVRLGVQRIVLRRLEARGAAASDFVALSPRLGLLEPYLVDAVAAGLRRGVSVHVQGFPHCAARSLASRMVPAPTWVAPAGVSPPAATVAAGDCGACPDACAGAPADYVGRFGWTELRSEGAWSADGSTVPVDQGGPVAHGPAALPPPRGLRPPATRVGFAIAQSGRALHGDPVAAAPTATVPEVLRVALYEGEPTRSARVRLVRAAQVGAPLLRIAGGAGLSHPAAPELLREAKRLSAQRVEVAGEASALDEWSDAQLRRLRGLTHFEAVFFGPDAATHDARVGRAGAWEAAQRGLARLARIASVPTGATVVVDEPADLERLDGEVGVRLGASGDLDALAAAAENVSASVRDVVAAVIPPCLLERPAAVEPARAATMAWGEEPTEWRKPSAEDRLGAYDPCSRAAECAAASRCPGLAAGWSSTRIRPVDE